MILFLELLLAHFTGDFFLQSKAMVKEKEEMKLSSKLFYLHILIHFILILVITWDITMWKVALYVVVAHFLTDLLKITLQNQSTRRGWFYFDQLLHIAAILIVWSIYTDFDFSVLFAKIHTGQSILFLLAIVILTTPASAFVKMFISKWTPGATGKDEYEALSDAGKYIGILERLLAFFFIINGHWTALGFLITAKSVFRFGDLKESRNRELTEYILIGTLVSFGIAVLTATGCLMLLAYL